MRWRPSQLLAGAGRMVDTNRLRRPAHILERFTARWSATNPRRQAFEAVDTVCLMVGHAGREVATIGSVLGSHPAMAFADRFDVLDHVTARFDRFSLLRLLTRAAVRDARTLDRNIREAEGRAARITQRRAKDLARFAKDEAKRYVTPARRADREAQLSRQIAWESIGNVERPDLVAPDGSPLTRVEGWPRGQCTVLQVLGESSSGLTTEQLAIAPHLLTELEDLVEPASVKLLHLVSNPYDSVAVIAARYGCPVPEAIDRYFAGCSLIEKIRAQATDGQMLTIRCEDFEEAVADSLEDLCAWLGVDPIEAYLDASEEAVQLTSGRARHEIEWRHGHLDLVDDRSAQFEFLDGYSFEMGSVAAMTLARGTGEREEDR